MVLEKQHLSYPMNAGLESKADPFNIGFGQAFETAENVIYSTPGQIRKRNGTQRLDPDPAGIFGEVRGVFTHAGNLLMLGNEITTATGTYGDFDHGVGTEAQGWGLFHTADAAAAAIRMGRLMQTRLAVEGIASEPEGKIYAPDMATVDGYEATIWSETGATAAASDALCCVRELATGAVVYEGPTPTVTGYGQVHAQKAGHNVHLMAANGTAGKIKRSVWQSTTPTTSSAWIDLITDLHADSIWDCCTVTHATHGECVLLAYKQAATNQVILKWYDSGGTAKVTVDLGAASDCKGAICVTPLYNRNVPETVIGIFWQDASDGYVYYCLYHLDCTEHLAIAALATATAAETVRQITAIEDPGLDAGGVGFCRVYIEVVHATRPELQKVRQYKAKLTSSGLGAILRVIYHVGLASKAFKVWNRALCWFTHDSGWETITAGGVSYSAKLQDTYFLKVSTSISADDASLNITKALPARADGLRPVQGLSACVSTSTGVWTFAGLRQGRAVREGDATNYSAKSVCNIRCDFGARPVARATMAPDTVIGAGRVAEVNTTQVFEAGFDLYPQHLVHHATGTTTGHMSDGTYLYCAVYEWTDASGQVHQSAPSPAISIALSGGGATQWEEIEIPTLLETQRADAVIVLYRTIGESATGSVFFRVGVAPNDLTAETYTIVDTLSDAQLQDNSQLYTTGGVLENIAPPASGIICARRDRVFLVPDEDRTAIWPSKIKTDGSGLAFNDFLPKRMDTGGDITAIEELDDKILVFKAGSVRMFYGDGPNDQGLGQWSSDQAVSVEVGCAGQQALCKCDRGIVFWGTKGVYLLNRGLQLDYIGAPVEGSISGHTVVKAITHESRNSVYLYLENNTALVWDYQVNRWAVFTAHNAADATIWGGLMTFVQDGAHYLEVEYLDHFVDDLRTVAMVNYYDVIPMKIKTGWLNLGRLQGMQRVWWVYLLGLYEGAHALTIKLYSDYSDSASETVTVTPTTLSAGDAYKHRIKPLVQKVEALQLEIYDTPSNFDVSDFGEGFRLSGIDFDVGVKRGSGKRHSPSQSS